MHFYIHLLNIHIKTYLCIYTRYDEAGNTKGIPEFQPPPPTRLSWDLTALQPQIEEATLDATKLINVSPFIYAYTQLHIYINKTLYI